MKSITNPCIRYHPNKRYPIAFYFIGAYIREYQPTYKHSLLCIAILGFCLINPLFNLLFVKNHTMIQIAGDGNGIIGMPLATIVFLLLYRLNITKALILKISESISRVSLDMYLASFMFDIATYTYFRPHINANPEQAVICFFIVIPIVFIESWIFSLAKSQIFKLLHIPTR